MHRFCFLPLGILIAAINFWTMPGEVYQADPRVIRITSLYLLKHGNIGIDENRRANLADSLSEEGQYYFYNREQKKFHSKWGILNTFLFLPPLLVEEWAYGIEDIFRPERGEIGDRFYTRSLVLFLNLYNLAWTLGIAFYLFKLAGLYTTRLATRYFFVLSAFYCTFLWHYLRAQTSEIFQVMFFAGFFYHLIRFQRTDRLEAKGWMHLLVSMLFLGALTLTKTYYILLFPPVALFVLLARKPNREWGGLSSDDWKRWMEQFAWRFVLPTLLITAALAVSNWWRFGSPFESGYGQWKADGRVHDEFSIGTIPAALSGYLFSPHWSLLLYFPPLLISMAGIRRFLREYRPDLVFAYSIFGIYLLMFSCFSNWTGAWCYGPRYLLFIMPIVSLPLIPILDSMLRNARKIRSAAGLATVACVLLYSLKMQIDVNSLPFFAFHKLQGAYSHFGIPEIDAYFNHRPVGLICGDFRSHRDEGMPFYPTEILKAQFSEGFQSQITRLEQMQKFESLRPNYYWQTETAEDF